MSVAMDPKTVAPIIKRLIDHLPALTRLHASKKLVLPDAGQVDLLVRADRLAVAEALAALAGRVCLVSPARAAAETPPARLARLDDCALEPDFPGQPAAARLAWMVLVGWTMAETLLLEIRLSQGRDNVTLRFFEQRCAPLVGLVRDVLPGRRPAWFVACYPDLARAAG